MTKGIIVSPANRGVQVVVTDENNVQLLIDSNRGVNLEIVPQPRIEVLVDKGVEGAQGPVGPQGPQGPQGTAATVTAGTTTTGLAGTNAIVTNSGTSSAAVFDFTIPRGDTGLTGATGAGVAVGGTTGQVLVKASNVNYDTTWATITGTLVYQGSWNASTNTPTLTSSVGTNGYYYVVGTSGSTNLNGITDWVVGDWAIFNGTIWQKIDNTDLVSSVNGQTGVVVLTASSVGALAIANNLSDLANTTTARTNLGLGSIATQDANNVAITGGTINNTTIGATTPAAGTFTTLTATGQTSLGGVAGSDVFRVLRDNTFAGTTVASFTAPQFSFIPPQSSFGAAVIGLGLNPRINSFGSDGQYFSTNQAAGFAGTLQVKIAHTASAVNYHQLTGSATGSGPIHSVAGSDTNIDLNLTTKGTGGVRFNTGGGEQLRVANTASAVNYVQATGGATGGDAIISAQGSDSSVGLTISSKLAGNISFQAATIFRQRINGSDGSTDLGLSLSGGVSLKASPTGSQVNFVQVNGAATSGSPVISVQGSDTNSGLQLRSKGTGDINLMTAGGTNQVVIRNTASAVNFLSLTGSATGVAARVFVEGSDTNIPLVLQPKGTGALQAQQTDSTATGGNARGANAVDWQTSRGSAAQVASANYSVVAGGASNRATGTYAVSSGGNNNTSSGFGSALVGGNTNTVSNSWAFLGAGQLNTVSGFPSAIVGGTSNTAAGFHNFIGAGFTNSGTSGSAVTTQSATMNGTTAVTLSGSNASIKVGQIISGTSIGDDTYVAAISGTSLTLSKVASGSSTSTLSFFTPHGVVVGGGNNQATGSYSYIGGGGDAGTAANRNVASGDWSVVSGGLKGVASGQNAFVGGGSGAIASGTYAVVSGGVNNQATGFGSTSIGGYNNISNSAYSATLGGNFASTRGIEGISVFGSQTPLGGTLALAQSSLLVLAVQTTDATATVLRSNASAASTNNQIILPNNAAFAFKGTVIANVTGAANGAAWSIEGAIMRGANAASTVLMGTPAINRVAATAGATAWAIAITADTTNGGLAVTVTGAASTTIRWVCSVNTTETTF